MYRTTRGDRPTPAVGRVVRLTVPPRVAITHAECCSNSGAWPESCCCPGLAYDSGRTHDLPGQAQARGGRLPTTCSAVKTNPARHDGYLRTVKCTGCPDSM